MNLNLKAPEGARALSEVVTEESAPASGVRASSDPRSIRIFAKSIYRELRQSGHQDAQVVQLVNELVGLLASEMKERRLSR